MPKDVELSERLEAMEVPGHIKEPSVELSFIIGHFEITCINWKG